MTGGSRERIPPTSVPEGFKLVRLFAGDVHLITLAQITRTETLIIAQRLAIRLCRVITVEADGQRFEIPSYLSVTHSIFSTEPEHEPACASA